MSFQTDAELKKAYAERLKQAGKGVLIDVSTGEEGGTIDILTERELIFCTVDLDKTRALLMKSKLDFISRFSPNWQRVVVVQNVIEPSAVSLLTEARIQLVNISIGPTGDTSKAPTNLRDPKEITAQPPPSFDETFDRESLYTYPTLNSVAGGEGARVALAVIGFVILFGGWGAVVASMRSPEQPASGLTPYSQVAHPS